MENKHDLSMIFNVLTLEKALSDLVNRFTKKRKNLKLSREKLSKMSDVSYGSIRRFETTGKISLVSLLKLADAIGELKDFTYIFNQE